MSVLSRVNGSSMTFCPRPRLPSVNWTPTPVAPWTCSSHWPTRTGGGASRTAVVPCARLVRGRALWWVAPLSLLSQISLRWPASVPRTSKLNWTEQGEVAGWEKSNARNIVDCTNVRQMSASWFMYTIQDAHEGFGGSVVWIRSIYCNTSVICIWLASHINRKDWVGWR